MFYHSGNRGGLADSGAPPLEPPRREPPRPVTEGGSRHPPPWRLPWPSRRGGSPPSAAPGGGPRQNLQGGHPPWRIYRGGSPAGELYFSLPDGDSQQPLRPLNRRSCASAARGSRQVFDNQATSIPAILACLVQILQRKSLYFRCGTPLDESSRCDQLALTSDPRHPSQALRQVTAHKDRFCAPLRWPPITAGDSALTRCPPCL